jgi:acetyltransferase-like isoleucine patch superfamily enzyme
MTFPGDYATKKWLEQYKMDFLTVECGGYSYGRPLIRRAPNDSKCTLRIGRYCSIAEEVLIFVGGEGRHATDILSTYPLQLVLPSLEDPKTSLPRSKFLSRNLDVEIGHDVWIGTRVTIMAGVKIGTGAVIGACSLVTRDVEPYSVVGGVPAHEIKKRHPADVREALLASRWWEWEPDIIASRLGALYQTTDMSLVLRVLSQWKPTDNPG